MPTTLSPQMNRLRKANPQRQRTQARSPACPSRRGQRIETRVGTISAQRSSRRSRPRHHRQRQVLRPERPSPPTRNRLNPKARIPLARCARAGGNAAFPAPKGIGRQPPDPLPNAARRRALLRSGINAAAAASSDTFSPQMGSHPGDGAGPKGPARISTGKMAAASLSPVCTGSTMPPHRVRRER
jgi:hypothetical protein